jgi:hypothetical protein
LHERTADSAADHSRRKAIRQRIRLSTSVLELKKVNQSGSRLFVYAVSPNTDYFSMNSEQEGILSEKVGAIPKGKGLRHSVGMLFGW